MIRRLRLKFVCVVMAIVMLMLGIILGMIIGFTGASLEAQSIGMMRAAVGGKSQREPPGKPSKETRLPCFTVRIGSQGELSTDSRDNFDLSGSEYLPQMIQAAQAAEGETGTLPQYQLRFLKVPSPAGLTIVFSDTSSETAALRSLFGVCLLIFAAASAVFLGLSILLSHWAVKPVETAWNQQRQFVADASHELKTPLSVIMANAELLQNEGGSEEERRRFSGNILSTSYQMRSLVENMLEMARVDNGTEKLRFSLVDLSQLAQDAVLSFQLLYEEQEKTLESQIAEGIFLQGSEQHLYQVMDVLLDNALKYSSPQGNVHVCLTQRGRSCLLSVSSPGEPLSGDELKNIFKRFYRADKARSRNGSYGLGLSIAESIVTAHKGRIWAESREGSNIFHVYLPLHHTK